MSIFATIAIVCTMSKCNDYGLDHADTRNDSEINTQRIYNEFDGVWESEKGLTNWLKKYQIDETIFEIVSIDFENREIPDEEIP